MKIHKQGEKLAVVMEPDQLAQISLRLSQSPDIRDRILAFKILEAMREKKNEKN
jgi:hypothetical protein